VPQVIGYAGLAFTLMALIGRFVTLSAAGEATAAVHFDIQADYGDLSVATIFLRFARYYGWCVGFLGAATVTGILPAILLFLIGTIRVDGRENWRMVLIISVGTTLFCYVLFHHILHVPWPHLLIGDLFPDLRSTNYFNIL